MSDTATLGEVLTFAGSPERIREPERETFVTVKLNGGGAVPRQIGSGKTTVAFTGYRIKAGQLIYSRIDARNGAFALVPEELDGAVVSKDFPVFQIDHEKCVPAYLDHFFRSGTIQRRIQASSLGATNRQRISEERLLSFVIPLPPVEEQRRIAAILDQADALRAKRREALDHLDDLTQSIFIEMFGRPLAGEHRWPQKPLAEICEAINDCPHSTPKWTDSGEICLRTSNLTKGGWDWSDTRYVSPDDYAARSKRGEIRAGDLILSREGTVGIAALVPDQVRMCMGQRLVQVRPAADLAMGEFLLAYLLQALAPERIAHVMVGSTARHLNVKDLRTLSVPVPPVAIQRAFATKVTAAKTTETQMRSQAIEADRLFTSLQARAFSGRL